MPGCGSVALRPRAAIVVQHVAPAVGQTARLNALELGALRRPATRRRVPATRRYSPSLRRPALAPCVEHVGGHFERRVRPAEFARAPRRHPPRTACRYGRRAAPANARCRGRSRSGTRSSKAAGHGARSSAPPTPLRDRGRRLRSHASRATRKRAHTSSRDRERGAAVVGDLVVVPAEDQLAQSQMPGERNHLLADALLQAAVADECIRVVIDDAARRSARARYASAIAMPNALAMP